MSSSNCCFLICILISQEAGQVIWYSHLFKNFSQLIVIHTVKDFGIVNKAESRCFSGTLLLFRWSNGCWQLDLWSLCLFYFLNLFIYFNWRLITLHYCSGFCHTLTWISRGCTCVPHPEPPSQLLPHPIPQGHPCAQVLSALFKASKLDWWSISHMVIYMFQCYSLKSSHPHLLPQSPKVCSLCLCLFCCLPYRVIVTIFLNSIYVR